VALTFYWGKQSEHRRPAAIPITAAQPVAVAPTCGDRVLRDQGIGKLQIGMPLDSVKTICRVVLDTVRPGPEGMTQRVITVAFPPDAVEAEIVDGKIWRLDIDSPAFRTPDSLAVGSTLSELRRVGGSHAAFGEGKLFLLSSKHCGLSFRLAGPIPTTSFRNWTAKELAKLPEAVAVDRILVYDRSHGCPDPERPVND